VSRARRVPAAVAATALLAALLVAAGLGVGLAGAGDNVAAVEFQPSETAVAPGETVAVDVVLESDGSYDDVGLYRTVLRLDYPAEHVSVVGFERGPWLTQEDPDAAVATDTRVADDAGVAEFEQRLRDPGDGVTGRARLATVRLAIAPDAPASTLVVTASESRFLLAQTRYPQPVEGLPAELHVDGGGDRVEPDVDEEFSFATPTPRGTATPDGDTAESTPMATDGGADGADSTAEPPATGDEAPAPAGAAVLGVLLAALLWRRR